MQAVLIGDGKGSEGGEEGGDEEQDEHGVGRIGEIVVEQGEAVANNQDDQGGRGGEIEGH